MPARPFPFQLGIGTDIVHIPRIRRLVERLSSKDVTKIVDAGHASQNTSVAQLLRRYLTQREQVDFWSRFGSHDKIFTGDALEKTAVYLAGRWAAKEATIKAHSHRRLSLLEIEILRYPSALRPKGVFALIRDPERHYGTTVMNDESPASSESDQISRDPESSAEGLYGQLDGQIAKISISHDGDYATAICMAAEETMPGDVGGEAAARMF